MILYLHGGIFSIFELNKCHRYLIQTLYCLFGLSMIIYFQDKVDKKTYKETNSKILMCYLILTLIVSIVLALYQKLKLNKFIHIWLKRLIPLFSGMMVVFSSLVLHELFKLVSLSSGFVHIIDFIIEQIAKKVLLVSIVSIGKDLIMRNKSNTLLIIFLFAYLYFLTSYYHVPEIHNVEKEGDIWEIVKIVIVHEIDYVYLLFFTSIVQIFVAIAKKVVSRYFRCSNRLFLGKYIYYIQFY